MNKLVVTTDFSANAMKAVTYSAKINRPDLTIDTELSK